MVVGAGTAWRGGFVQCDRRPRHRRSSLYYVVNVNFSMKYFSTRRCFRRQRRGQATRDRSTREAPTSARVSRERAVRRALGFVFHATCAPRAGVSGGWRWHWVGSNVAEVDVDKMANLRIRPSINSALWAYPCVQS
ncbi:hypothetical protein B296_00036076 [Ensete ventricosum]|uniref:Uncharacterized protein n=1 Tax=Ensete ventricosum TaxID=4639 RepID=A0A426Y7R7_ENSVE|nr:hypothetical protein B296_00036076 [Ensete ventricosum]